MMCRSTSGLFLASLGGALLLSSAGMAQVGPVTPGTTASRASLPPAAHGPQGPSADALNSGTPLYSSAGSDKVYYTDSNSLSVTTPFYEYDVATDAWTRKQDLPGPNTSQLCADVNGVVHAMLEDGNIYQYDPTADAWNVLMAGPPAAFGRHAIAMFETHNGEFFWEDDGGSTLNFTKGGVWTSVSSPSAISCAADFDHATGLLYIRTYGEMGFMVFDPATGIFPLVCSDPTAVSENARAGALSGGEFFTRDFSTTYQAIDIATCKKRDTLVAPTSTHSSSAADENGLIYSNGWSDDTVFEVYDPVGNSIKLLAPAPDILGNAHSTLVATGGCPDASWTNYGTGWPGTGGIPAIVSSANPVLGSTITIATKNSLGANTTGYLAIGYADAQMASPFGGMLLVAPMFFWEVKIPAAGYSNTGTLPGDPIFCGFDMYVQLMTRDAGASAGFSFTPGLKLTLGQ